MANILIVHQNFPAQFKHLAPALVQQGHQVIALTLRQGLGEMWYGVRIIRYTTQRGSTKGIHPWISDIETKTIRGEACLKEAIKFSQKGYNPDIILAHPGWGESLFLKDLWPNAKLAIYGEFFYRAQGLDVGFDPEFPSLAPALSAARTRLKNAHITLHFDQADAAIAPTQFQANTFPESFRDKITVIHDGIDTQQLKPNPHASLTLQTSQGTTLTLNQQSEVITFVNRNLEPLRGYHQFMRALPTLLQQRPNATILIVGGDDVSYSATPTDGKSYKQRYIDEVRPQLTDEQWQRIFFLGKVNYDVFIALLQLSTVHVYLTYPFVLSWSLLEAMSIGCTIVASDTAPVKEVITHNETGKLVNFFDNQALAAQIIDLLNNPEARQKLGQQARAYAVEHYDLVTVCLPQQLQWINEMLG